MRGITKAALGGMAGCALILGGTQAAGGEASTILKDTGPLGDFLAAEGPFDSARARVTLVQYEDVSTTFSIKITGIDISASGQLVTAHLHTDQCVDGDYADPSIGKIAGSKAGPHYNHQMVPAGTLTDYTLAEKSPKTEVWFDLVPSEEDGAASFSTTVPFVPVDRDGVMSIVVHIQPTVPGTGFASTRQACFPLAVPQWILSRCPPDNTAETTTEAHT